MFNYIIRRTLSLIPVLIGVSIIVFSFIHMIPGDPVIALLGERATPENVERAKAELGLDKPLWEQYIIYMNKLFHGDLGKSIRSNTPVASEIASKFPATFELTLFAMILALIIGIPAGLISAWRRNSIFDTVAMFMALLGVSMPVFWLGLMLIFLFSVFLGWLPFSGRIDSMISIPLHSGLLLLDSLLALNWTAFKSSLAHLILPSLALCTIPMAIIARMTRSCLLEELGQDYIRTAKAKGLKESQVILRHALKNAILPVITTIGLQTGALLSGAILTETIFSWPGIGSWVFKAITSRDYPIVQGAILFIALIYVLVNLLVDTSYAFFDPRIKYQ